MSEKGSVNLIRKSHSKKKVGKDSSNYWKGSRAYFRGPKAVSDEIRKNPRYEWYYNGSNCWRGSTLQILCDKRFDKCFPRLPRWTELLVVICFCVHFWLNSPDLNLMDYYVWSVIERVTTKRHPVTSLQAAIEAAFTNMDKGASSVRECASASGRGLKQSSKQKKAT